MEFCNEIDVSFVCDANMEAGKVTHRQAKPCRCHSNKLKLERLDYIVFHPTTSRHKKPLIYVHNFVLSAAKVYIKNHEAVT